MLSSISLAVDCWNLDAETTCEAESSCEWKDDPWGSWCQEKSCWNQWSQSDCEQSSNSSSSDYINKSCNWQTSDSSGWCDKTHCWSLSGTNETACESNSVNLNCDWTDTYSDDSYFYPCDGPWEKSCWTYQNQTACTSVSGCTWGACEELGCWDYSDKTTCEVNNGTNNKACKWNSQYSYCQESGCWDYGNQSACTTNSCTWGNNYCYTPSCWDFSKTNQTGCENNTASLDCAWQSNSECWSNDCWSTTGQSGCEAKTGCSWETSSIDGWCEETNCWSYDGTNASACENNSASITNCIWESTGNYCWKNWTATNSYTNYDGDEKACYDSFGVWNESSQTCQSLEDAGIETIHNDWNPGCYIFDYNSSSCNSTEGCYWLNNICETNLTILPNDQLNCTVLNESSLCNGISSLSSCCAWQGSSCSKNKFSDNCHQEVEEPPEGAAFCEDYNAYTDDDLCIKISGSPWYMPCKWNNDSERCGPRLDKIFDRGRETLLTIDNKQSCEYAGGKWITENYCEGSISVPTGRCEAKFDEERNCNRACFACEYKKDGTNWSSSPKAKEACVASKIGYCEFISDTTAENGYGECSVKDEFKDGIAGDCNTDCGSCSYKGDPTASDDVNKPSYFCRNSDVGCKWIPNLDNPTDESQGRCASTSEKTCEDRCDKCDSETQCTQYGQKKGNTSLDKQCNWDDNAVVKCQAKSGADEMEICWDGVDNNNDGKMDCADSMCFSDPFCGGDVGEGSTCFNIDDQNVCTLTQTTSGKNCTWMNENWGSWCDIPGSDCWTHDGTNQTFCEAQECEWHAGFGGFCEEDWKDDSFNSCFNANNESSCSGNCTWVIDNWCAESGGWCQGKSGYSGSGFQDCWQYDDDGNTTCNTATDSSGNLICEWFTDPWCASQGDDSAGWCDHKKFSCWQYNENQTQCTNATNTDWCEWRSDEWGSWCESKTSGDDSCWNQYNSTACSNVGCNWITGFCDPPGFGGGTFGGFDSGEGGFAGTGTNCWKYDGNLTGCNNQSGCTFFEDNKPFCDMEKKNDCFTYNSTASGCNATNGCYWNSNGNWCSNLMEQCWNNFTISVNETLCNANSNCNWTTSFGGWEGCQPTCFGAETEAACGSGCTWINGWCGSGTMSEFFDEMEGGAPIELGHDDEGDASPNEVDINGFGMKDMGDAFGFGISVKDLANAALCNGKKLGFGTTTQSGSGKNTTKFYWYFDTDGNRSGNCALEHNSTADGFEFYATAVYKWNTQANSLSEQYTVNRCNSGSWTVVDIKASGFPQKSCSEIGGGMIALEKVDFERFPTLYTTGADIRVAVATANNSGNISNPTDTADSGFATPGAVDFDMDSLDFFRISNGSSQVKGLENANKGYVEYNADCWNITGCSDYSCYNHPYCLANSYGVHASGFEDSRTPKVIAVIKEMYENSAVINYYTDKPSNGSLLFYHNDSSCSTLNTTILDKGLTSLLRRNYTLPHTVELYNDTGVNSLNYSLSADTSYFYKIKVCDDQGKCGLSKCSEFVTSKAGDCRFCDFVTRISTPSGWNVSYDVDQDGSYEHEQGQVCGASAGMKTNYTAGRNTNIKLYKSDNSSWLEFFNVRLTKTAMSSKIRTISDSGSIPAGTTTDVSGNTIGYAGMVSSTRDKIVKNLHPEKCLIKIPGTGTCSELWHCNDDFSACVDRTAEASLNVTGSDYCIWQIPYCEFSTWAGGQPTSSSSSSGSSSSSSGGGSSGGGVSGGGGKKATLVTLSSEAKTFTLNSGDTISFKVAGDNHSIKLKSSSGEFIVLQFASEPFDVSFKDGETKEVDVTGDNNNDLRVTVKKLALTKIEVIINLLSQPTCTDGIKNSNEEGVDCGGVCDACATVIGETIQENNVDEESKESIEQNPEGKTFSMVNIFIIIFILIFGVYYFIHSRN